MQYRVVQSQQPLPALARDVDQNGDEMTRCSGTQIIEFAGIAKTNGPGATAGVTSIELQTLLCEPYQAKVVSFVATVLDRRGDTPPGMPTPMIVWHPIPPPQLRIRVRSIDANGNIIPDVEFGWQAVIEIL